MALTEQQLELLNQLQDIQLPEPITWWPLAFSSWVLISSFMFVLMGVAWYLREQRRRYAYRLEAQKELRLIMQSKAPNGQSKDGLNSFNEQMWPINLLLKHVALTTYGRQAVAPLSDQAWLDFLKDNAHYIEQPPLLNELFTRAYQAPATDPGELKANQHLLTAWHQYAEKWIKGHHQ